MTHCQASGVVVGRLKAPNCALSVRCMLKRMAALRGKRDDAILCSFNHCCVGTHRAPEDGELDVEHALHDLHILAPKYRCGCHGNALFAACRLSTGHGDTLGTLRVNDGC